jgi:uncharacterized protein (TIRG00374 family)
MGGVAVLALYFVYTNRGQLPEARQAAAHASPGWLAVAAALAVAMILNYGALSRAAFRAVGVSLRYRRATLMTAAGHFLNTVIVNSGGMAGVTVFLREADRVGFARGKAMTGYLVVAQLGHFVFAGILVVALIVAHADREVTRAEWLATGVFAFYTSLALALLVAAVRSPGAVRFVHALPGRVRRRALTLAGRRPSPNPGETAEADDLYAALSTVIHKPRQMALPAIHALGTEALGIGMLWALLRAFGAGGGIEAPLFAYAMGVLFSIVGFLPAGAGFAEAGLGLALVSSGVAGPVAALVVVSYRVLETWIPVAYGAWAAQHVFRLRGQR